MSHPIKRIPLQKMRLREVKKILKELSITRVLDGGAGEGEGGMYWMANEDEDRNGIEIVVQVERDEEVLRQQQQNWEELITKLNNIENENIQLHTSLTQYVKFYSDIQIDSFLGDLSAYNKQFHNHLTSLNITTCILCEVIEHSSFPETRNLINTLLSEYEFETLILTTPNKGFNKYLNIPDDCFRHSDHEWEMTSPEWHKFVIEISNIYEYTYQLLAIGDIKEDGPATQGVVFQRTKQKVINNPSCRSIERVSLVSAPLVLKYSFSRPAFHLPSFAVSVIIKYLLPRSSDWSSTETVMSSAVKLFDSKFSVSLSVEEVQNILLSDEQPVESQNDGAEIRCWPCWHCNEFLCYCDTAAASDVEDTW